MGIALVLLIATTFLVTNHFTSIFNHPHILEHAEKSDAIHTDTQQQEANEVFMVVEEMPQLIGGLTSLTSKLEYPQLARAAGIQGKVYLQFVVQKDGSVSDAMVIRGIGAGCDEEALRVIRQAKFTPGKQRGVEVPVKVSIPVSFKL